MIYIIHNEKLDLISEADLIAALGKAINTSPDLSISTHLLYYKIKYATDIKMLEAATSNLVFHETNK